MKQWESSEEAKRAIHDAIEQLGPMTVADAVLDGLDRRSRKGVDVKPAQTDNWRDKGSFRCETCQWFVEKDQPGLGRCRRRSPTLGGYPVVWATDWCGEHKLGTPPRF